MHDPCVHLATAATAAAAACVVTGLAFELQSSEVPVTRADADAAAQRGGKHLVNLYTSVSHNII